MKLGVFTVYLHEALDKIQSAGYEGVISIEHEDSLMSIEEGFEKAVAHLKSLIIRERVKEVWWA
ncbi:hypothetical protein ABLT31_04535 [Ammoniphilus sp. 3BR4]